MKKHTEKHFTSSDLIKDIVIGMADGLTVPFALAAGLSSAVTNNDIIVTAGIAEIVAGSIAMGLGGYLAGRTDYEHYYAELKREYAEVETMPEEEKHEVREIFAKFGVSEPLQHTLADELSKDKKNWVEFMMQFELGMEVPNPKRAIQSAITIGVSYIVGGIIPLFAYFVTTSPSNGLKWSAITTVIFLFIFGYIKTKLTGESPFKGALKTVFIGIVAAVAAFYIAKLVGR